MHTEHEIAPIHEKIEYRAYQIYLEHGFHDGSALADWLAAEEELTEASRREEASRTATNSTATLRKHITT
jgi:hypothetical protein